MRWLILALLIPLVGCAGGGPRYSGPNDCPPRLRIYYPDYTPCAPVDSPGPEERQGGGDRQTEPDSQHSSESD